MERFNRPIKKCLYAASVLLSFLILQVFTAAYSYDAFGAGILGADDVTAIHTMSSIQGSAQLSSSYVAPMPLLPASRQHQLYGLRGASESAVRSAMCRFGFHCLWEGSADRGASSYQYSDIVFRI